MAEEQERQAQVMFLSKLTEVAFEKCVAKPDTVLSHQEQECIGSVMHKYVDAQKFIIGRYSRQKSAQPQALN